MKVTVRLMATYRKYLPPRSKKGACELKVSPGTTVREIISQFDIPLNGSSVILVNGRTFGLDHVPDENDVIAAFPSMAGG